MNTTFYKQLVPLVALAVVASGLLGYNFMSAQGWTAASGTAPSGNQAAPVNVGGTYQFKVGDLGAVRMRAGEYCNADGTICDTVDNIINNNNPTNNQGSGFGYNQTWRDMLSLRSRNVWYQNDTQAPIMIHIGTSAGDGALYTNTSPSDAGRVQIASPDASSGSRDNLYSVITVGAYYKMEGTAPTIWSELRGASSGPVTYSWAYSGWGSCSAPVQSCGTSFGTQTRTASCKNNNGDTVANSNCTGSPVLSQSCSRNNGSCNGGN